MVKWIPLQMPAPGLQRLLEPYGNFSPMGVLWFFIGASKGYEMFAGGMEVASAILLFIPMLATLGAMVSFGTAVQILDGQLDGHKMRMETRRFDHSQMLLLTRGFNWIQERPFNR